MVLRAKVELNSSQALVQNSYKQSDFKGDIAMSFVMFDLFVFFVSLLHRTLMAILPYILQCFSERTEWCMSCLRLVQTLPCSTFSY